jgi:hypothetical protein
VHENAPAVALFGAPMIAFSLLVKSEYGVFDGAAPTELLLPSFKKIHVKSEYGVFQQLIR